MPVPPAAVRRMVGLIAAVLVVALIAAIGAGATSAAPVNGSLSYSNPAVLAGAQFLDSVLAGVTTANGGIVADGLGHRLLAAAIAEAIGA